MNKDKIKQLIPGITKEQLTMLLNELENEQKTMLKEIESAEIDRLLKAAGAKNTASVKALLDGSKINFSKDGVKGFEPELERIKREFGYLFENSEKKPEFTAPANKEQAVSADDFAAMGYKKRLKLFKENPGLYKQLLG